MADEMPELQRMAAYKPNTLLSIGNLLTGGFLGLATGQTQRIQERNWARQKIVEEQAIMDRMKAQEELQLKAAIDDQTRAAEQQAQRATGGLQGIAGAPTDETGMSPFFATGYRQAQFEQAKTEAERTAEEKRNMPRNLAAMRQAGLPVNENITPAEAQAGASAAGAIYGQRAAVQTQAKTARAFLAAIGQPVPEGATDEEAIGRADAAGYQKPSAATQRMEKEQENLDVFFAETDPDKLKKLYAGLTPAQQRNTEVRSYAGVLPDMTPAVRKELDALPKRWAQADRVLGAVSALAGSKNIDEISSQNFNQLSRAVNSKKSALFGDDQTRRLVANIIQQFEGLVSGSRRDLFGASLTGNELQSAKEIYGDKDSANFLERVMLFMDGLYQTNPASYYEGTYRGVEPYSKRFEEARSRYLQARQNLKGVSPFAGTPPVPATGATNAPAGAQSGIPEVIRGPDGQLRYK